MEVNGHLYCSGSQPWSWSHPNTAHFVCFLNQTPESGRQLIGRLQDLTMMCQRKKTCKISIVGVPPGLGNTGLLNNPLIGFGGESITILSCKCQRWPWPKYKTSSVPSTFFKPSFNTPVLKKLFANFC